MTNTSARSTEPPVGTMAFDQMVPASIIRDHLRGLLDPSPRVTVGPDSRPGAVLVPILASGEPRLVFTRPELMARSAVTEYDLGGRRVEPSLFDMDGHVIWGATARILRDLLDLVESVPAGDRRQKGA